MNQKEFLPGVRDFGSGIAKKIEEQKKKQDSSYKPRTRHLDSKGNALFTNRLFLENSPYLLQHAHNPVNWYPWGEEAFQTAKKNNFPVLLSVGYSTCHWCHVMEEESFEDIEIAKYMNENYIAIKVDREERPDIDSVYMQTVQMMTGHGGWPMTVWLTPDKTPFFGGTYFPPRSGTRGSTTGFLNLLKELNSIYKEKREQIIEDGKNIQQIVQKSLSIETLSDKIPDKKIFQSFRQTTKEKWDSIFGGLKGAPKFPSSFPARFLIRSHLKIKDKEILQSIRTSLTKMMEGGMHDQVGGGFHRYSVDEKWLVPHFEKMLYDQALLATVYLEAYQLLKEESFKQTAKDILDYVIRDMRSPEGGFYSATDADSLSDHGEKEEGFYFTWTSKELDQILSKQEASLIKTYYGITQEGNFEGRNILHISKPLSETATQLNLSLSSVEKLLLSAKEKLYSSRQKRSLPLRDEKTITAWNGLMISAFVYGFFILNEQKYLLQAEKSARFILNNMYKDGTLYRSWKNNQAYIPAYLDDYAFFISSLLDLFEWTGHIEWLEKAVELDQILEKEFEDKNSGGFFMTAHHYENILAREKPVYDGAEPSGNAVTALNLLRLSEITGVDSYKNRAKKTIQTITSIIEKNSFSFSEWFIALDFFHSRIHEIILVLPDKTDQQTNPFFKELKKWYLPNKVLTVVHESQIEKYQNLIKPLKQKRALQGKPTVYICDKGACQIPAQDLKQLQDQLKEIQNLGYL